MIKIVRAAGVSLLIAMAIGAQPQQKPAVKVRPYNIELKNFKVTDVGLWRVRQFGETTAVSLRAPKDVVALGSSKGRSYNVAFGSAKFYRANGKALSQQQGMTLVKRGTVFPSIIGILDPATGRISAMSAKIR